MGKAKISKKIIIISIVAIIALLVGGIVIYGMILANKYNKALDFWNSGHKTMAVVRFSEISFYRDSNRYIDEYEEDVVNALRDCRWTSGEISYRSPVVRHYTYTVTFKRDGELIIHSSGQQEGFQYYSLDYEREYRFDYESGEPLLAISFPESNPYGYYSFDYDEDDETISSVTMIDNNDGSRTDDIRLRPVSD